MMSHSSLGQTAIVWHGMSEFPTPWQLNSHLDRTSITTGAAAEQAAILKTSKYADILHSYDFVPIAVETLGAWSDSSLSFVKLLGKRVSEATGDRL